MLKNKIIFIIFLISLPNALADPDVQYQIFKINLNASVDLDYTSSISKLVYFNSNLYVFPKDEFNQEVLEFDVKSNPSASVRKSNIINYNWQSFDEDSLDFGYDAKVKVNTLVKRIDKEIPLPDQFVEREYVKYVKPSEFIDINPSIRIKASEITANSDDLYETVVDVAEWIRINVKYDINTLTEDALQKSSWVLENKYGVCDEITNLFISFLRSLNIPTRYVTGIAFTDAVEKGWDLHAWAEVYFEGIGWVPFDVVFGEYGWVDSGHIKFFDSVDSDNPSVEYSWKAVKVELDKKNLDINSNVLEKGDKIIPFVSLDVNVLKNKVGSSSFIPIQVIVKNLQPYYLAPLVYVINGPNIIGDTAQAVLLKPYEEKTIYWTALADKILDQNVKYQYEVVVTNNFGASDKDTLEISYDYLAINQQDANMIITKAKNNITLEDEFLEIKVEDDLNWLERLLQWIF